MPIISPGWTGRRRPGAEKLPPGRGLAGRDRPAVFACGPTGFVEAAASLLTRMGHDASAIKTERFGSSGG